MGNSPREKKIMHPESNGRLELLHDLDQPTYKSGNSSIWWEENGEGDSGLTGLNTHSARAFSNPPSLSLA